MIARGPFCPHERGIHSPARGRLHWVTVESTHPYQRHHYRVPLAMQYPVMFSDAETIAEGTVMNLTVFGCAIECADTSRGNHPTDAADPPGSGTVTPGRRSGGPMGPRESNGASVSQGGAGGRFSAPWVCVGSDGRAASNDRSGRTFTF